jgi:uncharacterized protein
MAKKTLKTKEMTDDATFKAKVDILKSFAADMNKAQGQELEELKKQVISSFKEIGPKEFALAVEDLKSQGLPREDTRRLYDLQMEVMRKRLGARPKGSGLADSHPIKILEDEHVVIKRNLKRLKRLSEKLKGGRSKVLKRDIDLLKELSHFFLDTEKHHQREEEAIFPRLKAHGISEIPEIFEDDHVEFLANKRKLNETAMKTEKENIDEVVKISVPIIDFLTKNLEEHIYKEDNMLYPVSIETLDEKEWKDVRKKFDAIGYCCFAPSDI